MMPLRKLCTSIEDRFGSTVNPSQIFRTEPICIPYEDVSDSVEKISSPSKRRRLSRFVTQIACVNCRKARAKCDGMTPCNRCLTRQESSPCIYEITIRQAKNDLVQQIKELKIKENLMEQILGALSTNEQTSEILKRLKYGATYDSIVEWLRQAPYEGHSIPVSQHSANIDTFGSPLREGSLPSTNLQISDYESSRVSFQWTPVTSDASILDHLFQLYFAWVHPVHTLFSERHFVDSYKRQSFHYCSPTLVNAICALACHLHSVRERDKMDFERLSESFSDEVRLTIDQHERSLTTIQTFAVMFLVDCARGRCLRAVPYLNIASIAVSNVTVLDTDGFSDVLRCTGRGINNLNVEWALVTFQAPGSFSSEFLDFHQSSRDTSDEAHWFLYRYIDDQCLSWPGLLATSNRERSKLMAIIGNVTQLLYDSRHQPVEAHQISYQYSRLTSWYKNLPIEIVNIENGNNQALPHVLSLLILYFSSVVQLLRPLLGLDELLSSTIEEIVWTHAQQGLSLLDQYYRIHFDCRYQSVMQMFAILYLCDTVARFPPTKSCITNKDVSKSILLGLEALMQSWAGFPIAGPLRELLRQTALKCSINFPRDLDDLQVPSNHTFQPRSIFRMDDFIDTFTTSIYYQPVSIVQAKLARNFAADWIAENPALVLEAYSSRCQVLRATSRESEEGMGAQSLMRILNC